MSGRGKPLRDLQPAEGRWQTARFVRLWGLSYVSSVESLLSDAWPGQGETVLRLLSAPFQKNDITHADQHKMITMDHFKKKKERRKKKEQPRTNQQGGRPFFHIIIFFIDCVCQAQNWVFFCWFVWYFTAAFTVFQLYRMSSLFNLKKRDRLSSRDPSGFPQVQFYDRTQFELFRLNVEEPAYSSIASYWGNKPSRQSSSLFHLQPGP